MLGNAVGTEDQAVLSPQCPACGRPEKPFGCMVMANERTVIQMLCCDEAVCENLLQSFLRGSRATIRRGSDISFLLVRK